MGYGARQSKRQRGAASGGAVLYCPTARRCLVEEPVEEITVPKYVVRRFGHKCLWEDGLRNHNNSGTNENLSGQLDGENVCLSLVDWL